MRTLSVAVQMYSVKDDAEKDFAGTLRALKEMGYAAVELAGLHGMTPEQMRAQLDEAGLPAISAHVPYDELLADAQKTVSGYAKIGCAYIAVPYIDPTLFASAAALEETVKNLTAIGKVCKEQGIALMYHNHNFEFAKAPDGSYILDYLFKSVPADLLASEIDTCWVNVAGIDPAQYILQYKGRAPVVHFKDFASELDGPTVELSMEMFKNFEFRPVGHGKQDVPSMMRAADEAGAAWVVVEQDMSTDRTMMQAMQMSREYLKTQGW